MLVPETTMNENDFFPAREYQVRGSRQIPTIKTIPESHSMNQMADSHFRFCILPPYTPHEAAAKFGGNMVRHYTENR